jgi:hypothetical protein
MAKCQRCNADAEKYVLHLMKYDNILLCDDCIRDKIIEDNKKYQNSKLLHN